MLFLFCFCFVLFVFFVVLFCLFLLFFCFCVCDHRSTVPQLNCDLDKFLKINYAYQWQTSVHMIYIRCHVVIYIIYYLQTGEIVAFHEYKKLIRLESKSFDRTRKSNIMIKNSKVLFPYLYAIYKCFYFRTNKLQNRHEI
jgi:hypothetical protein